VTSPTHKLHVYSAVPTGGIGLKVESGNVTNWIQNKSTGSSWQIGSTGSGFQLYNDDTSSYRFIVENGGNVGIGTTSPEEKLHIVNAANASVDNFMLELQNTTTVADSRSGILFSTNSGTGSSRAGCAIQGSNNGIDGTGHLLFGSVNSNTFSEKMRITSGGEFGFGTTSNSVQNGSIYFQEIKDVNTYIKVGHKTGSSSGADFIAFYYDGSQIGGAAQSGTTGVAYNTSSDYRLKENVVSMTGALDRVSQLKPSRFNFITDADKTVDGFLAHEVQEIVPEAITGEKDAMQDEEYEVSPAVYEDVLHPAIEEELDEDGNIITEAKEEWTENVLKTEAVKDTRQVPKYQGIDQSKLVPLLVGAIQELKAEIDDLKNKCNCK
jgi:hypothetical protein